jgi:hypothetical protein
MFGYARSASRKYMIAWDWARVAIEFEFQATWPLGLAIKVGLHILQYADHLIYGAIYGVWVCMTLLILCLHWSEGWYVRALF